MISSHVKFPTRFPETAGVGAQIRNTVKAVSAQDFYKRCRNKTLLMWMSSLFECDGIAVVGRRVRAVRWLRKAVAAKCCGLP